MSSVKLYVDLSELECGTVHSRYAARLEAIYQLRRSRFPIPCLYFSFLPTITPLFRVIG